MKNVKWAVLALFFILGSSQMSSAQQDPAPYYRAGNTFYAQKNYDQAIAYYQYAVQINPNFWQAYQALGSCYYAKGDKTTALADYQKSLAINPNNPQLAQFVQTMTPSPAPALPSSSADSETPMTFTAAPASSTPASQNPAPAGGVDRNLPRQGKLVIELQDSDWLSSWDDIDDYFGSSIDTTSTPYGVKLGLGLAYAVSPNFQVGLKVQGLFKSPEELDIDGGLETLDWNENAIGGAIEVEGTFPMGDGINFIGGLEGGFYTLVGTTVDLSGEETGTADITGSAPGGMITAGVECLMDHNKTWALDFGLDYQFLTFSTLTDTPVSNGTTSTAFTLKDTAGNNAYFDFSGLGVFASVRFF